MNRTQRLSLGSALSLSFFKKSSGSATPPSSATPTITSGDENSSSNGHQVESNDSSARVNKIEDEIGPLTASPPASPVTRLSRSSASFFPASTTPASLSQQRSLLPLKDFNRNGSFAVHNLPKLRESKWFSEGEARIFCVVAEIGFIVEIRKKVEQRPSSPLQVSSDTIDGECNSNNKEKDYKSLFGVVTKKECFNQSAEDKKLHTYKVEITTIDERKKLDKLKLTDVWATNNEIRINNFSDKNKTPHDAKEILDKVLFARRSKNLSWHNTEHFSYWCRYGDKPAESVARRRQVSECIRWGSHAGIGTGMLMLINRRKTTSK